MKRLLTSLLFGQSLRHRPVAINPLDQQPVRAVAIADGAEHDITTRLFPISLNPLLLGIAAAEPAPHTEMTIRMEDRSSSEVVGELHAKKQKFMNFHNRITLFRPTSASVRCIPARVLAWRYALAWQQARRNLRDPHAFHMSFADLVALNVFYMMPRPVYLISVIHEDSSNIFPMDLVGPLGDDRFVLALRLTSPAVELMLKSGRFVAAGAPAAMKPEIYQLGAHHKKRSVDWDALPVSLAPSPNFAIPTLSNALGIRELKVVHSEPQGSHMVFVTSVANQTTAPNEPQLCHVSDMYARWRALQERPFVDA